MVIIADPRAVVKIDVPGAYHWSWWRWGRARRTASMLGTAAPIVRPPNRQTDGEADRGHRAEEGRAPSKESQVRTFESRYLGHLLAAQDFLPGLFGRHPSNFRDGGHAAR